MDRNPSGAALTRKSPIVATREGGVDRNLNWDPAEVKAELSPPARVAWIETLMM